MPVVFFFLGLILVIVLYAISVYNSLQTIKTRIKASIQEIGNQLKRQTNLIPNLSESAKAYLSHEKGIFELLSEARKSVETAVAKGGTAIDQAVDKINEVLPKLSVLVESNPQLKADAVLMKLMDELRDTADKLMYSRRTLIDLTADYNMKLVTFPSNLIAKAFGFQPEKGLDTPVSGAHLTVSDAETQDVKVDLN